MVKFNKEGIELIRNKIDTKELKELGRLTKNSFVRERKMGFKNFKIYS